MAIPIQDITKRELSPSEMHVYYVSGDGAYFGRVKYHSSPECRHLVNWSPAGWRVLRASGWREGKLIMRDIATPNSLGHMRCKTCKWP